MLTCARHIRRNISNKETVDEKSVPFDLCVLTAIQGKKKNKFNCEAFKTAGFNVRSNC